MSHTAKLTINENKGKHRLLACAECNRQTRHEILADVSSSDATEEGDIQWWNSYFVVQCQGCLALSFCRELMNTEDCDPHTGDPLITTELFPARMAGLPALDDVYSLPYELQRVYEETRAALMQRLPILAGIGIRAIVETVCNERSASGKDLAQKIDSLVGQGFITQSQAQVLHALRFMGNDAAHNVKAHAARELMLAFGVVEHLLDSVYVIPERAKRLPSRTAKGAAPSNEIDLD